MAAAITPKQRDYIQSLASHQGVDVDIDAVKTKAEASALIESLKGKLIVGLEKKFVQKTSVESDPTPSAKPTNRELPWA